MYMLNRAQEGQTAAMMADAFLQDPYYIHIEPDEEKRKEFLVQFFTFRLRYAAKFGNVYVDLPDCSVVSIWHYGKQIRMSPLKAFLAGCAPLIKQLAPYQAKLDELGKFSEARHDAHTGGTAHWHLSPIATKTTAQKQGLASGMIREFLSQIEEPVYLETFSPENAQFYKRFGFAVVEEAVVPGTEIPFLMMLRDAKPRK